MEAAQKQTTADLQAGNKKKKEKKKKEKAKLSFAMDGEDEEDDDASAPSTSNKKRSIEESDGEFTRVHQSRPIHAHLSFVL